MAKMYVDKQLDSRELKFELAQRELDKEWEEERKIILNGLKDVKNNSLNEKVNYKK